MVILTYFCILISLEDCVLFFNVTVLFVVRIFEVSENILSLYLKSPTEFFQE